MIWPVMEGALGPARKAAIADWRKDYNESRLRMALGNKTPAEYLLQAIPLPSPQGKKATEN
jgi:hypothetical protein